MENIDTILAEAKDFKEYPVKPKTKPLTAEEIAELDRSRKERSARMAKATEPAAVEPVPADPARRKADLKFMGRVVSGVSVGAGAVVAQTAELMDARLAFAVAGVALAFVAFWAGAWIQYRFGGLLNG